jgi:hypothetical protein
VRPSFTSTLQQQSTLCAAAKDDSNLRYFSYTRAQKPRLICNVHERYRAMQIQYETIGSATSDIDIKFAAHISSKAVKTVSKYRQYMPINLLVMANDSISIIPLMAFIESMPLKSIKIVMAPVKS